jgi:hypothetical protein
MSAIPQRIYETRIGSYKKTKPRITFEKRRLDGTAFLPGTKFRIDFKGASATITLDENGSRQVTSRNGDPVIDIKIDEFAHVFNGLSLIKDKRYKVKLDDAKRSGKSLLVSLAQGDMSINDFNAKEDVK